MQRALWMVMIASVLATTGVAAETVSAQRGEALFNDTRLGTNGKSCSTCHAKGKGLKEAYEYSDANLAAIVNRCIEKPLAGTPIAPDSPDMKSLLLYLRTFK